MARTDALPAGHATVTACRIKVVEGIDAGREHLLTHGECVVGTSRDCDLRLHDTAVSSRHCRIALVDGALRLTDLESRNGTLYLGARCHEAVLELGATIIVGRSRLQLASPEPDAAMVSQRASYGLLVGSSPAMRRLYRVLEQLEAGDATVLLQGETGVGKGLVARAIHQQSRRRRGPLEVLDFGAVTSSLIAAELFGQVRGAFTDAGRDRDGAFVRADGGTVFLDEIGELPRDLQTKLLRVLEEKRVKPVGSEQERESDFRTIAATHHDLAAAVSTGAFREDLYFRLSVVTVVVPSLRERREDIPALVRAILDARDKPEVTLSRDTLELFTSGYDWPGNVRELRNAIVSVLDVGVLPERVRQQTSAARPTVDVDTASPLIESKRRVIDAFEREYAVAQLAAADGNISQAARSAGMDRSHFKRMLRKHGLIGRG